jgi:type II secretion system (T2SS) protein E
MAMKLGEMLIEAGKLTPAQLEETLKSQVIFGGRLGTNLIEMGYLDEDDLVRFLSKKLGFPYATPEQLMAVSPEVIKLIPKEIAEKYKVIPLSRDKKRLTLAMLDPADLSVIDEISFVTGYYLMPVIAPELRLVLALEKYYDIKRDVRYIQIAGKSRGRLSDSKPYETRARAVPVADLSDFSQQEETPELEEIEIEMLSEPVRKESAGMGPFEIESTGIEPAMTRPAGVLPVKPAPPRIEPVSVASAGTEPAVAEPVRRTFESVAAELAEAKDREEIADTIVAFLGQEFERVALFMIRGTAASGWRAMRDNKTLPDIGNIQIPLDGPSVLKVVTDGKSFYLGPIPDTPGNAAMLAGTGGGASSSAVLIPLMMMGRVVSIVYVDGGEEPLTNRLAELHKLVGKAAMAFEILILKNKILMG